MHNDLLGRFEWHRGWAYTYLVTIKLNEKGLFMSFEARLHKLGLAIPTLPKLAYNYVPARRSGNLIFVSGQTPLIAGKLTIRGKLGREVSLEQGQEAARLALLNCLAAIRGLVGSLDTIGGIIKLNGYVASAEGFVEQPAVINGASILLEEIFGDVGRHARAAIGVAELPGGAPVEIELTIEMRPPAFYKL